jgi:Plasmid replication region DNA-binding N-term
MRMTPKQVPTRSSKPSPEQLLAWSSELFEMRNNGAGRTVLSDEACNRLIRIGVNPTVALVRQITGTGANDAIARDIEEWRSSLGQLLQRKELRMGLPEALSTEFERFAVSLWQQAKTVSEAQLSEDRLASEAIATDAIATADRLAGELTSAGKRAETLEGEIARLNEQLREAAGSLATANANNDALRSDVDRLQRAEQAAAAAHEKVVGEWQARLRTSQEASEKVLTESENNRKFVLMQLDGQRELERSLREQLKEFKEEASARENAERLRRNTLMDDVSKLSIDNGRLSGQLDELRNQMRLAIEQKRTEIRDAESAAILRCVMSDDTILNHSKQYHIILNYEQGDSPRFVVKSKDKKEATPDSMSVTELIQFFQGKRQ